MIRTPVVLAVFNRPKTTSRVLSAIRSADPSCFFVVADGPRPDHPDDVELCAATRAIIDGAEWKHDVIRHYSPVNLGLNRRMMTGLAWLFGQVDAAIILEDDCLPHPSFFRYCEELLAKYRDDEHVTMISGCNPLRRWKTNEQSYHFSHYGSHWGWATWRRAWRDFESAPADWAEPSTRQKLQSVIAEPEELALYCRLLERRYAVGSWDSRWTLTNRLRGGLAAVPAANLVSNIGFAEKGTHTCHPLAFGANALRYPMNFPLIPPPTAAADREHDRTCLRWQLGEPNAENISATVEQQLEAGRFARGLLLAEAGLRCDGIGTTQRARLETLKTRALRGLARKVK